MSLLLNVQRVKEAWLALDREYGNLDLAQLGMLAELGKLAERDPADELAENRNIVKVLGFYNIARHHKKHRELISRHFIYKYVYLLSGEHKREILKKKIYSCNGFIKKIKEYQTTNILVIRTEREAARKKRENYQQSAAGGGLGYNGRGRGRGNGSTRGGRADGQGRGGASGQGGRAPPTCRYCAKEHLTFKCPELYTASSEEAKTQAKSRGLCVKCLNIAHTGANQCSDKTLNFVCPTHKVNRLLCKCAYVHPTKTQN